MNNAGQQLCNDFSKNITAAFELMAKSGQRLVLRNNQAFNTFSAQGASIGGAEGADSKNDLLGSTGQFTAGSAMWLQGFQYWMGICEDAQITITEAAKLAQDTSAEMQVHMKEAFQSSALSMGPESVFNRFQILMNGLAPGIERMWTPMTDTPRRDVPVNGSRKAAA